MNRVALRSPILVPLLALLGCASSDPETGAKYDPLERFPRTGVWVWDEGANVLPEGPRFQDLALGPVLEDVITEALAERGYREGTDAAH